MKFIIPTEGTRGDVQPYIALALGLLHAGNSVTLASPLHALACREPVGVTEAVRSIETTFPW